MVDNGLDAAHLRTRGCRPGPPMMLPGMPGTEVCRKLREVSSVPIIMLTAKDSSWIRCLAWSWALTTT